MGISTILLRNALMPLLTYALSLLWRNLLPFPFFPCFREFLYPLASLISSFHPMQIPFSPHCVSRSLRPTRSRTMVPECSCVSPSGLGHCSGARTEEWSPLRVASPATPTNGCGRIKPFLLTEMHSQRLYWGVCFLLEPQQ